MEIPAITKILLVFGAMLALTRTRLPLGAALVLGGVYLDAWAGQAPRMVAEHLRDALLHPELWLLVLVTAIIVELGRYISADHNAQVIMTAARRWGGGHGRAASLMMIPAILGLVPVPGGALFSAPFVDQMTPEDHWPAEWKVTINYWFRHVWEYWWPIYPVTIVTLSIFELKTWQYMAAQIPMTGAALMAGYFFLVRPRLKALADEPPGQKGSTGRAGAIAAPLVLVLLSALFLPGLLGRAVPDMPSQQLKLISILLGLLAALLLIARQEPDGHRHRLFAGFFSRRAMNVLCSLGGVLVFKYMLEASNLLPAAARDLLDSGIPVPLVIALLPFIAGLVTGIAIGFAGTSFPLVAGLIAADSQHLPLVPTVVLAFACGYAGMMLSPVHLCLIVTRDYFSAHFGRVYRHLLPCAATVMVCGILLHLLLRIGR